MNPAQRVEMARFLITQDKTLFSVKQAKNADTVIKARGEVTNNAAASTAFDSINKKIKKLIENEDWEGPVPDGLIEFEESLQAGAKQVPPIPGTNPPQLQLGSGLHTSGSMYGSGQAMWSIHGFSRPWSDGWSPTQW